MSSLVSTGNCKLGHDCRRVCSHRRRDETRQFRLVGVGGVYWALVCSVVSSRPRDPSTRLLCQVSGGGSAVDGRRNCAFLAEVAP